MLLPPITVSLNCFSCNFLLPGSHTNLARRAVKLTRHIPPLPFFSASHPCFPVRLPFPCIDSHETFFSGNHTNLARCCREIVPAISILFCSSPHLICASPSDYCFPELLLMKLSFPSVHGPMPDSTAKPNLLYQIPFLLLPEILY